MTLKRLIHLPACALLLIGGAALAGCGSGEAAQQQGPGGGGGRGGPGGGGGGGGRGGNRTPAVETAAVTAGDIAREVTVTGTVQPLRTVAVNAQMSGALLEVLVEEGTPVRAGQTLARVDAREIAAQVRSAEAQYTVAEAAAKRAEQLRERQVITASEYERDRAAHDAARATLDGLRTRLGYSVVRAPVSGVVTTKLVERGHVVGPQSKLFDIAETSTLVVPVQVSELDVVHLSPGDPARVSMDAFPGQTFEGRIRRIFPAADPATRLVPVEVALSGQASRVARPGFLARVSASLGTQSGVLLVPAGAVVQSSGGEPAVFVVKEGKAERRPVETGLISQGQVQVVSGLQPGEAVVTVGTNNVRDGADVRVVAGPGAGAAPRGRPGSEARQQKGAGS